MSKFEIPKALQIPADADRDTLAALQKSITDEINRVNSKSGDLEVAELEELEAYLEHRDGVDKVIAEADEAEAALTARLEAARERAAKATAPAEEPEAEVEAETPEAEVEAEVEADAPEAELVTASGVRKPTVARARRQAPAVILPKKDEPVARQTIIAAANDVPEFSAGQVLSGMDQVAQAFLAKVGSAGRSNPQDMKAGRRDLSVNHVRKGVARIRRADGEFSVDREMGLEEQMARIAAAGDEVARFGTQGGLAQNALTAAGGWCAPSETIYDLFGYETSAGLIDVPEVTARRGGISFTKGPDFMTIFGDADAGFSFTEAQVEAGVTKPCYALECPPFTEVRLDAVGFCATAPLLTEAAYPELVRRVLNLLGLGHQRRKSASTIARISTAIGAGVTFAPVGAAGSQSGLADTLAAAELRANQIRQSLAMDPNATIEGVAPYWARGVFRTELSRRLGLTDPFRISDADIDGYFALRNIRLQYVYDYQMLATGAAGTAGGTAAWTAWPTTLEFMLWPAGAFVRLVNDVISLDAVYDHDLLTQNEYTAAFVEEGMAIANTRGFGLKTTVALNPEGASGFPQIGAGAGVTFASA